MCKRFVTFPRVACQDCRRRGKHDAGDVAFVVASAAVVTAAWVVTGRTPLVICWLCPGGFDSVEKVSSSGCHFFLSFLFLRRNDMEGLVVVMAMVLRDGGGGGEGLSS